MRVAENEQAQAAGAANITVSVVGEVFVEAEISVEAAGPGGAVG